jgi:hypothetical protein
MLKLEGNERMDRLTSEIQFLKDRNAELQEMKNGLGEDRQYDGIPDFIKKSRNHYWNIYQFLIDFVTKKVESEQTVISRFNMEELMNLERMLSFERKESTWLHNSRIEYPGGR